MFDLNDATRGRDNAAAWTDLFVEAIAAHLLDPAAAPEVPAGAEYTGRRRWLAEGSGKKSVFGRLREILYSDGGLGELFEFIGIHTEDGLSEDERRLMARLAQVTGGNGRVSEVSDSEVAWLLSRIPEGRQPDANEKALLARVRQKADRIHPSLVDLLARAGL